MNKFETLVLPRHLADAKPGILETIETQLLKRNMRIVIDHIDDDNTILHVTDLSLNLHSKWSVDPKTFPLNGMTLHHIRFLMRNEFIKTFDVPVVEFRRTQKELFALYDMSELESFEISGKLLNEALTYDK